MKPGEVNKLPNANRHEDEFGNAELHRDFKGRTIRGGLVTMSSQFVQFIVSTISTVVLARLLSPEDYGIVGMVAAVTGLLSVIKDSGLSTATVQRESVTRELVSAVFWINVSLGAALTLLSGLLAPVLASFYREPRLLWITMAFAATFLIDAVGTQHAALLRRQMKLNVIAAIDIASNALSVGLGILMAVAGYQYWALVAMPIIRGLSSTLAVWIVEPWRPSLPRRGTGVVSMLRFGGFLTGSNVLGYACRNVDNVMIGWYWGAGTLGLYQKAYSLLMLPGNQVNAPINGVAISALSRIQSDPQRYRRYFVGFYSIASSVNLPIVVAATIFAEDIIRFVLGEKWIAAANIFRLLAPAALISSLISPLGWLFVSSGRTDRQLMASLVWAPLIILAFGLGLRFGAEGVAIGYSAMSALLAIPLCFYTVQGTSVRVQDVLVALKYPGIAGTIAGIAGYLLLVNIPNGVPPGVKAIGGCISVAFIYAFVLLIVLRQWTNYRELVRHLFPRRAA